MLASLPLQPSPPALTVASGSQPWIPGYVEAVVHQGPGRLRLRLRPEALAVEGGESAAAAKLRRLRGVQAIRLNRWAGCCVIRLEPGFAERPLDWLRHLPADLAKLTAEDGTTEPGATEEGKTNAEADQEEEEERFVPSRVVLPVASLALALVATPLQLPPIVVAAFILVAARLTFQRAWQGLRVDRKINVDALDALAVTLHSLEGFLVGPALMLSMIEGGEAVRDAT